MKKTLFLFLIGLVILQGCCLFCIEEPDYRDVSEYKPVFMDRSELNGSIQLQSAKNITNTGKIYVFNDLLFVSEKREGFHIFDNSNPKSPQKIKFLKVPGSTDLAIRSNVLYFNQATDLVTLKFDLENESIELKKRIKNTFPELSSPEGFTAYDTPENNVVINWIPKK